MDFIALGKRIRQQRKFLKMTQTDLANAVDVSTSYIGHIERGLKHCSLETIVALSKALHVTPDMLLQDSLEANASMRFEDMSVTTRSMLNDIANILREYDIQKN